MQNVPTGAEYRKPPSDPPDFDLAKRQGRSGNHLKPPFWGWSITLGVGLSLFPIHNQWLTKLATVHGNTLLFIPTIGMLLIIVSTMFFLIHVDYWKVVRANGWGDLKVTIPLGIIVLAMGLSGITAPDIAGKLSPLFAGIVFFCVYLAARIMGKDIFLPLGVGVAIASLGAIVYQVFHAGEVSGGYIFEGNYDIIAGYVLLGTSLVIHKWRWILAGIALLAMLSTGSPEAALGTVTIFVAVLIRRDWSKKLIIVVAVAVVFLGWMIGTGRTALFTYTGQAVQDKQSAANNQSVTRQPIGYRLVAIEDAMRNIKPLGNGYVLTEFYTGIVHNVPLIIVQELGWPGILAGAAWLWVVTYCLKKSKWKYTFVLVLSLSVFDHFMWDQLAPWWWAMIGAGLASTDNDYFFRRTPCPELPPTR